MTAAAATTSVARVLRNSFTASYRPQPEEPLSYRTAVCDCQDARWESASVS